MIKKFKLEHMSNKTQAMDKPPLGKLTAKLKKCANHKKVMDIPSLR